MTRAVPIETIREGDEVDVLGSTLTVERAENVFPGNRTRLWFSLEVNVTAPNGTTVPLRHRPPAAPEPDRGGVDYNPHRGDTPDTGADDRVRILR